MTLPSSGIISFSNLRNEFYDGNSVSLGDLYRGGTYVSGTLPDGTSINSGIPTSGAITISNFYNGSAKCKSCQKNHQKLWVKNNREKTRGYLKKFKTNNLSKYKQQQQQ